VPYKAAQQTFKTGVQDFIFSQCGKHSHLLEIQKLHLAAKNMVDKGVDFYVQNALKLTCEHL